MSYESDAALVGKRADAEIAALHTELAAASNALDTANAKITDLQAQVLALTPRPTSRQGIYITGGAAGVDAFEKWLGKPVDLVHQYSAATGSPPAGWGARSSKMLISLDMLSGYSFADVVAGKADALFTAYGNKLVAAGMGSAIIRLGWEYNGSWMKWSQAAAGSAATWKAAFRAVVGALRQATGQHFVFEWNLAQGKTWDPLSFPGPDVVDVCGADTYAGYTSAGVVHYNTPASRTKWFNGDPGDATHPPTPSWLAFVRLQGLPTAVSEWGCWEKDDAAYCNEMLGRFHDWGNLAYQVPFNVNGHDGIEHRFPSPYSAFGAAYKAGV